MAKKEYVDISLSFGINPLTKDVLKVRNDKSINQSIKTLLLTHFNERPFQTGLGSRLNKLLFDLKTSTNLSRFKNEIQEVLFVHEPRINVVQIDLQSNFNDNFIKINIFYSILNNMEVNDVEIVLTRIR